MAQNDVHATNQPQVENEAEKLKYLEFVQLAVLQAIVYASKVYGYAKDNSGSLKPHVESVEGAVKTVVGPAYEKFHHVPVDVLKFVDHKVDESVTKLPPLVKQVSSKTKNLSTMASEVKAAGVVETASGLAKTAYTKLEPTAKGLYSKYEPTAKGLYSKYEPVAEQYAVSAWHSLNQLPVFPKVAKVVVPKAAYYSKMYNQTVQQTAEEGYKVSSYLPLVPTEKIAKVFNSAEPQAL